MSPIRHILSLVILNQIVKIRVAAEDTDPIGRGSEIIGGKECDLIKYSFVVTVIYGAGGYCGGSMITLQWVLTAAHCFHDHSKTRVRSGFTAPPRHIQMRHAKKLIQHSKYDRKNIDKQTPELRYDIGLILVDKPFKKTPYLSTVTLPTLGYSARCKRGKVLGVGVHSFPSEKGNTEESFFKKKLMCVDLPIVNTSVCAQTFPEVEKIDYSIICTMATDGKDACSGDSGGPLLCEDKVVVGVVSVGKGCAFEKFSATYTRVDPFLPFINGVMKLYEKESRSNANRVRVLKVLLLTGAIWSSIGRNIIINT